MSVTPGERRRAWLPRVFQGLLLAIVVAVVAWRIYSYFVTSETELAADKPRERDKTDIYELREIANEAFGQKNWELAAQTCGHIAELDPSNTRNRIRLAHSLFASGQHDAALLEFLYLCRYEGNVRHWALYNVACIYALKGDDRLALDYLSSAISEGFRPREPISGDDSFSHLKGHPEFLKLADRAKPYTQRELYRRFDFLVGDWTLVRDNDAEVGSLTVSKGEEGASIRGGYHDKSVTLSWTLFGYVDPADGQWFHVWVDNQGGVMQLGGGQLLGESFLMEGTYSSPREQQQLARAIYTAQRDGTARMELATSPDGGQTWTALLDASLIPNPPQRARDTAPDVGGISQEK